MSLDDLNFSADELLAGLEATTVERKPSRPESIASAAEIEKAMAELTRLHEQGSSGNITAVGPTRAAPPGQIKRKPAKLERVESITGRPEEFFQTIKRQKPHKGHTLQVGNYQLGEKLGKGAFGTVYKGLDMKTGQFVAVKRIAREFIDGDHMLKEINLLKTFNHKNIVKYVGVVQTERHLNLVLEYVDSGSLAQVLSGYGFFPEPLAAIYVSQVLDGLIYLHAQQVVHRDIKGGNLLITREGSIKVADFGIATVASTTQRHSLVEGSPYWMAPEVIQMTGNPTTASDIWSLGCTLIELLTGFPPYFELTAMTAIFRMVEDAHPPLPDDMSPELTDFVTSCFKKDPNLRPTAAQLRNHPWIKLYVKEADLHKSMNVDDVRTTIKRYTLSKEAGTKLKTNLANLSLENEDEPYSPTRAPSTPDESQTSSPNVSDEAKRDKRRAKKNSISFHRQKKDSKGSDSSAATDATMPYLLTIFNVETRRSIFAFTIYHIQVVKSATGETWNVERTWSDFKELHTQLTHTFPNLKIPNCPQKKFWGVMEADFVRRRWQELQHFLVDLAQMPDVRESATFIHFVSPQTQ